MSHLQSFEDHTLYLIDGSGFIFRAYHALPPLTRGDGTPIGAVLGFTNMLVKVLKEMQAHYLGVVFDAGRHTFRNDLYAAYKANRGATPEDLVPQFPLIRDVCRAFDVPLFEREGFEADDLIATYSTHHKDRPVVIVSSDKDLMQLVSSRVKLYDPIKNKMIDEQAVQDKFGVGPDRVIDVQALIGDSSDNIPGVPGIGPKTAAALIQEFGTLDALLEGAEAIPQQKRRETILAHREQARLSRALVALDQTVPEVPPLSAFAVRAPDKNKLKAFLEDQEFNVLARRLFKETPTPTVPPETSYTLIQTGEALKKWVDQLCTQKLFAFDTETTSLDAKAAQLVGVSLATAAGKACYIPVRYRPQTSLLDDQRAPDILPKPVVLAALKPVLENPDIKTIGHNLKYDQLVLRQEGINIRGKEDTMLLSYLQQAGRHGLDFLAENHLQHRMIAYKEVVGAGKKMLTFDQVPLDQATAYAAEDADYTYRLHELLKDAVSQDPSLKKLYETIDLPLIDVLVNMEDWGIKVDPVVLNGLTHQLGQRLHVLESEIHGLAGTSFNIGSPKQLGEVLFDQLGLPQGKKSRTGAFTTDSDVLEGLALDYEIAAKVLEWRHLSKLRSTYTTALTAQINPKTGRVHTSYAMAVTSTGRLSSSDPNLQNIPIRTEEGRNIRKAFVAEEGFTLASFDYSQIELRLLAHMAQIPQLIRAFQENQDIHKLTASQVFGIGIDEVTSEQRSQAKAINFGIIYGISSFGLAKQLKIDRSSAAAYIEAYHAQYPGIKQYMKRTTDFAKNHGYVETLWQRRCFVPNIYSKNAMLRNFAERQAINAPLQGSNADFIKKAMIQIHDYLTSGQYRSRLLLQVHDELIFELHQDEVDTLIGPLKNIMETVEELSVPLVVGIGCGPSWEDAH